VGKCAYLSHIAFSAIFFLLLLSKKSNVTVEELFELYVGEYHPELKPTTVQQYRFLYDYYLKDFIGKVKLKNLLPGCRL